MTNPKYIAHALRQVLKIRVDEPGRYHEQDDGATLAATRTGIRAVIDLIEGVPADTLEEGATGPENEREEVVGTSTKGQNANFSNTGFGGGRTSALEGGLTP